MKIISYQVNNGDCILIEDEGVKLLIDLGFYRTYDDTIGNYFSYLKQSNQNIELVIISHIHRDHISGMKKIFENGDYNNINQVVFNNPNYGISLKSNNEVSIKEANTVASLLNNNNILCYTEIVAKSKITINSDKNITFLTPSKEFLQEYIASWINQSTPKYANSSINDWNTDLKDIDISRDYSDYRPDNKASLALLYTSKHKNILMLGDSHIEDVVVSLKEMGYSAENKLKLYLVKLSHHGSCYNISNDFLKLIDCKRFLVSGNGHNLDKLTIAKISNYAEKNIDVFFNYNEQVYKGLFSEKDKLTYNLNCFYGDRNKKNVTIVL